jgi:sugar/nucleoside kinase (ribokinase family)
MRVLRALGPKAVVVTLGPEGCAYLEGKQPVRVSGFNVDVVDTTGAGDAFHGAYLFGLLQGWDAGETASFANAVAALNCRALGGRGGLSTLAKARALMETQG